MPLLVSLWETIKEYIEETPGVKIYYRRIGTCFEVLAGQLAWRGEFKTKEEADEVEGWLMERGAIEIEGWVDVREVFRE